MILAVALMKGFVRDNLGSDFGQIEVVEGVKTWQYDWAYIAITALAVFVPLFIAALLSTTFLMFLAGIVWAAIREVVQTLSGPAKR